MALPNIYKQNKGFTIIEIIMVMALLAVVLSFGFVIDLKNFQNNNFQTEESKVISILEKARSSAMANISDTSHGVCYDASIDSYVIFKGINCTKIDSVRIPANATITENPGTTFPTFVFARLSGNTTAGTIHLTDGITSADITINNEGTINW